MSTKAVDKTDKYAGIKPTNVHMSEDTKHTLNMEAVKKKQHLKYFLSDELEKLAEKLSKKNKK